MEKFFFTVEYNAIVTEKIIVEAKTKEEAIQKIKEGKDYDDVIDSYVETYDVIDIMEI